MNASATFPEEWWHGHSRAYVSLMRRYERRLADAATHVFVVSARMRTYLLELGIAPEKVILLPNAADPKRFIPEHRDAGAIRAQFRLQDKVVVGFAGAFRRFHDVDIVLNAAAMLQHTETQVHILLVGEGPSSDRLQSRVREEGLSSMVTFAGRIPHEQMPAFVGAMDVTLAPAPALEEFHFSPLKIFEYMGAAKPVIASRIGEIETIIREGENGLLVAPGDVEQLCAAIRRLVRDPAMRERLGRAARRDIETKHNWTRNAAAVVDVANQSLNRDLKFWQRGSTKARATQLRADLSE
jgi:glycosyltransferase involved in cell wall biosynthesis